MSFKQGEIRKNLLTIYSGNQLNKINDDLIISVFFPGKAFTNEEKQKRMEELTNNNLYLNNKNLLEQFKKMIEKEIQSNNIIETEQEVKIILSKVVLNNAISLAYDFVISRDSDIYNYKMQLLRDLIRAQFIILEQWNQKLAQHFEFVFPILKDWYSFFFSYTNKEGAKVNKKFEPILSSLINIGSPTNQVARYVADALQKNSNPISFIDEKEIEYGDHFKEKIDGALKVSYTFVQFISRETFMKIGAKNWCQYEFDGFKLALKNIQNTYPSYYENALRYNMFFLVTGKNLNEAKPAILVPEYEDWFSEVGSVNYTKFCSNANPSFKDFEETINNVALAIVGAQTRLINAIPPN